MQCNTAEFFCRIGWQGVAEALLGVVTDALVDAATEGDADELITGFMKRFDTMRSILTKYLDRIDAMDLGVIRFDCPTWNGVRGFVCGIARMLKMMQRQRIEEIRRMAIVQYLMVKPLLGSWYMNLLGTKDIDFINGVILQYASASNDLLTCHPNCSEDKEMFFTARFLPVLAFSAAPVVIVDRVSRSLNIQPRQVIALAKDRDSLLICKGSSNLPEYHFVVSEHVGRPPEYSLTAGKKVETPMRAMLRYVTTNFKSTAMGYTSAALMKAMCKAVFTEFAIANS